jgi:hypothetical protein
MKDPWHILSWDQFGRAVFLVDAGTPANIAQSLGDMTRGYEVKPAFVKNQKPCTFAAYCVLASPMGGPRKAVQKRTGAIGAPPPDGLKGLLRGPGRAWAVQQRPPITHRREFRHGRDGNPPRVPAERPRALRKLTPRVARHLTPA